LNDHRVIGAIDEAALGVEFHVIDVIVKNKLFRVVLSKEDTRIVNEKALVHAFDDVFDVALVDVTVDATGGDAGIADCLGLLGDAFGVVECGTISEHVEHPLKLHLSDSIGKLANEDADTLLLLRRRRCGRRTSFGSR